MLQTVFAPGFVAENLKKVRGYDSRQGLLQFWEALVCCMHLASGEMVPTYRLDECCPAHLQDATATKHEQTSSTLSMRGCGTPLSQ